EDTVPTEALPPGTSLTYQRRVRRGGVWFARSCSRCWTSNFADRGARLKLLLEFPPAANANLEKQNMSNAKDKARIAGRLYRCFNFAIRSIEFPFRKTQGRW